MRNPFKRAAKPAPPAPHPSTADVLADVDARLSKLEGQLTTLRMEWAEVLDKINAWASRQAARDRRAAGKALEASLNDDPPADGVQGTPPTGPVSKDELRRRAFGGSLKVG